MQEQLTAFYQQHEPAATVRDVTPIADGWETDVYRFTLDTGDGPPRQRILRLYPGQQVETRARSEYAIMQYLYDNGYPVPQVFHAIPSESPFKKPGSIMAYIEGQPLAVQMQDAPPDSEYVLMKSLCQLMVDLHGIEWQPFLPEDIRDDERWQSPAGFVQPWLEYARQHVDTHRLLELNPLLDWLQAEIGRLQDSMYALTHGDFHPFNVLVHPQDGPYVIDWSSGAVSDLRYDLAWTLILMGGYEGEAAREGIYELYRSLSPHPELPDLEYFEVMCIGRRLSDAIGTIRHGAEQSGLRQEAAEQIKHQHAHYVRLYTMLRERTGETFPDLEVWLDSFAP